ncbi:hypothetical protein [Streptomyces sp. NBC_01276]|uniref:hypothetical protein n=1 Tax=Streptomyces sp. NBC_01276 TaxID=2903808 RepID=UPI00352FEAD4
MIDMASLLGRLGSVAEPAADVLVPLAARNPDQDDDHADRALAALVRVPPARALPPLAAALGRRPRALDSAAGLGHPADCAFPFDTAMPALDSVFARAEQNAWFRWSVARAARHLARRPDVRKAPGTAQRAPPPFLLASAFGVHLDGADRAALVARYT